MEALKKPVENLVSVILLHRAMDEELRHWLLGQALKRIKNFCVQYDSDADGIVMSREVERDFAKDRDHEFMILLAVRSMKVVGHLLADMYRYYGRLYVSVRQFEMDERVTLEQQKEAFQWVVRWKKEVGAVGIRTSISPRVPSSAALVMWYREFGFRPRGAIMEWQP